VREQATRAATRGARALVAAESGLDAEAVALAIHRQGSPTGAPWVVVDCARTPGSPEVEIVLFGRPFARRGRSAQVAERVSSKSALLAARGGTLLLANVADLSASVQARLARIVRDGEVRLDGSPRVVPVDARILASCGPTIEAEVAQGSFRADLFRRLSVVRIDVPPLRLRAEDVPAMARGLMEEIDGSLETGTRVFTKAALALLSALPWPDNVRELREVLTGAAAAAPAGLIRVEDVLGHLRSEWRSSRAIGPSLREARRQFEREYIAAVLGQHGWRMSEAAQALGIQRTNLYRKARQLNIPRGKLTR
jgi:two-component system nitrogen regulation response regulator NtrX